MKDIKIDLVYLWVNGNDDEWKNKKQYWAEKLGIANGIGVNNDCRFVDNEELRYSLRSAQMYAPWINKIFIVTDNQVPAWLDTNHPKIKIIDHKDIMPTDYLPCFNSNALETCIDKIPELSEYFLYANDDMFFSAPIKPSDFFDVTGKPIVNLRFTDRTGIADNHTQNVLFTIDKFNKVFQFDSDLLNIDSAHCIDAYRKSYIQECKRFFKEDFTKTAKNKFRTENQIQRIIYNMYALNKSLGVLKINPTFEEQEFETNVDNLYLGLENISTMKMKIETLSPKLLCINDNDYASNNNRQQLKQLLSKLFDKIQEWEIKEDFNLQPHFKDKKSNAIVFSFNDEYCKYFAVTLQSIISNSSKNDNYDIIIFSSYISENNKKLLYKMLPKNFNLRFFDVLSYIQTYFNTLELKIIKYWSIDVYFRLFIPLLMNSFERVLYLDSDIIVDCNLNELFNIDFDGKEILAVKDTYTQMVNFPENYERLDYIKNEMKMSNEKNYFNSGMIMFNTSLINTSEFRQKLIKSFEINNLHSPDQDILNMIFENKVHFLELKWNLLMGHFIYNSNFMQLVKQKDKQEYQNALDNPKIIHFTSPRKPWNYQLALHFEKYWEYARITPFYEEILYTMNKNTIAASIYNTAMCTNLYLKINQNKKILLWGASLFLKEFLDNFKVENENIVGIIDKNPHRRGEKINDYEIYLPEDINELDVDEIIVTIVNRKKERMNEIEEYINNNIHKNIAVTTI